ncbi:MAG: glycosyltransferase family 4 protein [Candidatus Dormibacteraeota bacterium]|nr:glycosyltransferase family 4 protein [Candidatus Dormibacteraeota bacterium]
MIFAPQRTLFVILSFEGPDVYSQAGGLGVRVKGLARTLAQIGYETHLFFCGDPDLPGEELHEAGRLHYRRWCQWISAQHRGGVYDGEEDKVRDWNSSLPLGLINQVIAPSIAAGRNVVVLGEEWHTATSINLISDALYYRGLRDRVVMLWNANNTFGFQRINWGALAFAASITTVSRYMKFKMWDSGQNPMVIPNGIPRSAIRDADAEVVAELSAAAAADHFCFKIGRFDPDKRWLMAVSALGYLKRQGRRVRLVIRGGREPHGGEVLAHSEHQGLTVVDVSAPGEPSALSAVLRQNPEADVINLTSFVSDEMLGVIYSACDAVLANSGHEPFGLVGLEVMAAGGLAVTGSTGEDYAAAYRNALVMETDDPIELVTELNLLKRRPQVAASIRRRGKVTARRYIWEKVIDQLLLKVEFAAAQQAVRLPAAEPTVTETRTSPRRGSATRARPAGRKTTT